MASGNRSGSGRSNESTDGRPYRQAGSNAGGCVRAALCRIDEHVNLRTCGQRGCLAIGADRYLNGVISMQVLSYVAAALIGVWGIAHAVPTKRVVAGFTPITVDNRRVLIQEWLAESCTMWGMAALVVVVTATAADTQVIATVYRTVAGLLVSLAVLTALTGARTPIVWFNVCPVLLATSAALLLASIL